MQLQFSFHKCIELSSLCLESYYIYHVVHERECSRELKSIGSSSGFDLEIVLFFFLDLLLPFLTWKMSLNA